MASEPKQPARRRVLQAGLALAATGAMPRLAWADAGSPSYVSAARLSDGSFALLGVSEDGQRRFQVPLPGRGHAAATHPSCPLAVAFARRPGTFALVLDCATGAEVARLTSTKGRHFYGHGAFDETGRTLFTCENAYEAGEGRIGVWDAADGFKRVGEFASGGVGPHELVVDHAAHRVVIGNGGIRTHPDSGRAKLNLATMRPNLAYADVTTGALLDRIEPPKPYHQLSLRHLAIRRSDGLVAVAGQWQGDPFEAPPLLALHRFGEPALRLCQAPDPEQMVLQGYAGSIAISGDGTTIALTAPRGGRAHVFDASGRFTRSLSVTDVCGVAPGPSPTSFLLTDGLGEIRQLSAGGGVAGQTSHSLAWDNHLIRIAAL